MKQVFSILMAVLVAAEVSGDEEKYTTKFDNINFKEIIASDRLLRNYINCLMDKGACTSDASELKRVLPEALETDCQKCSETQRNGVFTVIRHLIRNRNDWWNELLTKYDPEGKYSAKYKHQWEEEEIISVH